MESCLYEKETLNTKIMKLNMTHARGGSTPQFTFDLDIVSLAVTKYKYTEPNHHLAPNLFGHLKRQVVRLVWVFVNVKQATGLHPGYSAVLDRVPAGCRHVRSRPRWGPRGC